MAEIWFSSDLHLWHDNIISFCNRPFENSRQMNEMLLEYHNSLVRPQDHWYNLGDVTLRRGGGKERDESIKLVRRFHGHKRLVLGNHDHFPPRVYMDMGFEKLLGTGRWIENLCISHVPVHGGSMGTAVANIHGHIHDHVSPPPVVWAGYPERPLEVARIQPYVNVCVEWCEYKPIHYDEVMERVRLAVEKYREELENGEVAGVQTEGNASSRE